MGMAIVTFLALLAACAGGGVTSDWHARIGEYSLNDTKRELGSPESCVGLDDGGTVCSWTLSKGKEGVDKLVLTFGPDDKLATANNVRF